MRSVEAAYPPRPYQEEACTATLDVLRENRAGLVVLPTGCHRRGQPILMADGVVKPVEEIQVGERLMGLDGSPRTVLRLARGREEMVEIRPVKGDPWVVNRSHVLTLVKTPQSSDPLAPPSLRGGDLIDVSVREWERWSKSRKHLWKLFQVPVEHFHVSRPSLPIEPYFLGLLLGDGTLSYPRVEISSPDPEIVAECERQADLFGLTVRSDFAGRCPRHRLVSESSNGCKGGSNRILTILRDLGLCPVPSQARFVPAPYLTASWNDRYELLAGLLDTDGSLDANGSVYDFCSKSPMLADGIAFVARSLGFRASVRPAEKYCQTGAGGVYHRVTISGNTDRIPCRVARRNAATRRQKKNVLRTGFSIHHLGIAEDYYGFSLDGDGRYLLGDFTVTHNTGKTFVFSLLAKLGIVHGRRVLILVDRDELVNQAVTRLKEDVFLEAEVEKGARKASRDAAMVVASVQSLHEERLHTWDRENFNLIVVDEAHHAVANTYKRVFDHFHTAKLVGVTATPDRPDAVSLMGTVFDEVAYEMTPRDAVNQGWLVEPHQQFIAVDGLDYTSVRRVAGELSADDLDSLLRNDEMLRKMVKPTIERVGERQAIVFCATVAHAHAVAEYLRTLGRTAAAADGKTSKKERKSIVEQFRAGDIQYAVNCGLWSEGFDAPRTSAVVMMRPTLSRIVYAQQAGRGARPYPTDLINNLPTAALRRAAIAESSKPDFLLLDFVGNSGKHKLVHSVEALEPRVSPEITERVNQILAERPNLPLFTALEEAERAQAELTSRMREHDDQITVWSNGVDIDPFAETPAGQTLELFGMDRVDDYWGRAPTEGQIKALKNFGIENAADLNRQEARQLLNRLVPMAQKRRATVRQMRALIRIGVDRKEALQMSFDEARIALDARPASENQAKVLRRFGYAHDEIAAMTFREASSRITAIQENNWQRPRA